MLYVTGFPVGMLQANCYILYDSDSGDAAIIDPGDEGDRIVQTVKNLNVHPNILINTHGHGDHIGANRFVKEAFSIPLAIHRGDASMLTDAEENLSAKFDVTILSPPADILLDDGCEIDFAGRKIRTLHTPGHSPGGCCLHVENHLFTGDALFKMTIGRTDVPGGSHEQLMRGIFEKILALPDDTILYPGHGPLSTVGEERRNNYYILSFAQYYYS